MDTTSSFPEEPRKFDPGAFYGISCGGGRCRKDPPRSPCHWETPPLHLGVSSANSRRYPRSGHRTEMGSFQPFRR